MTHDEARRNLLDLQRRRLAPGLAREVSDHLAGCPDCARAAAAEAALGEAVERRPRHPVPPALRRRLERIAGSHAPAPTGLAWPGRPAWPERLAWPGRVAPALAAALVAVAATMAVQRARQPAPDPVALIAGEAVNDHLRVLRSAHPLDVESGARHEVKPWFEGKLGFAPAVPAAVGQEMRLRGGGLGWFLDREAAVMVYALRRHAVTLLAFPVGGLAWPDGGRRLESVRGFNVVLWRSGGIGYALVSDVDAAELSGVAEKMAAGS